MAAGQLAIRQGDPLDLTIDRPSVLETTALGAAYLAGRGQGVYADFEDFASR